MSTKQTANKIVNWYRSNARDLPWRHTTDPYKIWLSEIILQQTTIAQGTAYYSRFVNEFPTIVKLANSPLDKILKLWEGLGYYSRARNLHFTAQYIVSELEGVFPKTYDEILKLKGVGPYTAAAISSFSFNEAKVVVDGNVLRVMSRYFGLTDPIDIPSTIKTIRAKAQELLETQTPSEFNQAIMEFGALCCTYKKPSCIFCPLQKSCLAFNNNLIASIPTKSKKIKKRTRYFHYFLFIDKRKNIVIEQRTAKDIWQGLYQFPMIEIKEKEKLEDVPVEFLPKKLKPKAVSKVYNQLLTHQKIKSTYHIYADLNKLVVESQNQKIIQLKEIKTFAWPSSINNFLADNKLI